jgi:hypothetical protein
MAAPGAKSWVRVALISGLAAGMLAVGAGLVLTHKPKILSKEPRSSADLDAIASSAASIWRSAEWRNEIRPALRGGHIREAWRMARSVPPFAKGVTFTVENTQPALGSSVSVVGRSGAGKVCSLVLRKTNEGWIP